MEISDPSPAVINSVQGAIDWLDKHRIKNTRWEIFTNKEGLKTGRLYPILKQETCGPAFMIRIQNCHLFAIATVLRKKTLEEIGYERRNGYSWYTTGPQEVIDKYPDWKAKWVK